MEEMLQGLAARGHEVTLILPRVHGLQEGNRAGVRIVGAPYAPRPLQVWGYGRSLNVRNRLRWSAAALTPVAMGSMALTLRSAIARHHPEVIHLHWVLPQGILAFALPSDLPVVVSVHGADAKYMGGPLKGVARKVLQRADALIAASPLLLELVAEVWPGARRKSHVIPHGANRVLFRQRDAGEARKELKLGGGQRVILAVGRLVGKKGFSQLIQSMRELDSPDAHLYIIGEGPERAQLQSTMPKELVEQVHLLGAQPRSVVARWMAAADVVVVPSVPDGLDIDSGPVVLVEALASGRPVVSTPVGMAPALIQDGVNGYMVAGSAPAALAEAISKSLTETERLGQGALRSFESLGDWGRVAAQLEDVYVRVLDTASNTFK